MAGRLNNKKTLITAAGQGIGRSTVLAFTCEDAQVLAQCALGEEGYTNDTSDTNDTNVDRSRRSESASGWLSGVGLV